MSSQHSRSRQLVLAMGLNLGLAVAELVGGLVAHSVGLLADTGHDITDVAGLGLSLLAVHLTARPRDPARSFGYHRSGILAALANTALIGAVTVAIAAGAAVRLWHPRASDGSVMLALAGAAVVVNGGLALAMAGHRRDLNMRSAALHAGADAAGALAVVVAGALLVADGSLHWADPVASLVVAAVILVQAYRLLRSSVEVLLESSPQDVDLNRLLSTMVGVPGVAEVHDLHVWSLSTEVRALSAHLVVAGHPTLEEAQAVGEQVKEALSGPFAIAHATLELECERCAEGEEDPCLMDSLVPETPVPGTEA